MVWQVLLVLNISPFVMRHLIMKENNFVHLVFTTMRPRPLQKFIVDLVALNEHSSLITCLIKRFQKRRIPFFLAIFGVGLVWILRYYSVLLAASLPC